MIKIKQWLPLATVAFLGCFHYEEPLSNEFRNINYQFIANYQRVANRDSVFLWLSISSSDLTLNYRIRGVRGKFIGGRQLRFLMSMTDTVTITWYNGNGDSLVVPLRMNKAIFDSLPLTNDTAANVFHPGDNSSSYYVNAKWIIYSQSLQNWDDCRDSAGTVLTQSAYLNPSERTTFMPPEQDCKLDLVYLASSDSVIYGNVVRQYFARYHHTLDLEWDHCPCTILE